MMSKKNHYSNKRSEYRLNYLPFDYYDFWITAKENENLRFKNKLRDYLHTPFDWDENLELYQESADLVARAAEEAAKLDRMNQGTQTTIRPNRHDHLKRIVDQREELERKQINVSSLEKAVQTKSNLKKKGAGSRRPKEKSTSSGTKTPTNFSRPPSKSASIQVDFDKKKQPQRSKSANKNLRNQSSIQLEHAFDNKAKQNELMRSMSNMSIQTPIEWNLRDYSRTSIKSAPSQQPPRRSYSMANIQPKRPPFANYGWAVKTKDLSLKPTHNALANKILAVKYHDDNAINELKMQRLRKDATEIANVILANESKALDRFRSDSKDWTSEYGERYPDYTKTGKKRDLYFSLNPNKLRKSAFSAQQPNADAGKRERPTSNINFYYNE